MRRGPRNSRPPADAMAVLPLSLFVPASQLLVASFARTFKEGQSLVGPFYMLLILPMLFIQGPDTQPTLQLALIPVVNVALNVVFWFRMSSVGARNPSP